MNPLPTAEPDQTEDSDLLRRYVDEGSQDAFAELVRRRIGLVYSVALRQTNGDGHRAKDATQMVFTDLARKAQVLAARPVLAGWLYRSARLAAAELIRAEQRRQRRERESHTMEQLFNEQTHDQDWQKIRPVLDDVLTEIGESDRDAIMLRFFDGRTFAEIGARLRLSENTARMRVQRALDQLNAALGRRGVNSTAAALGVALANQIGAATPAGLAASVTGAALAQVPVAAAGCWFAAIAGSAKLQLAIVGGVAVTGAVGYVAQQQANGVLERELGALRQQQQAVAALRAENSALAAGVTEIERLRRDDAEFKQLAQEVETARKAGAEKARLARAQAARQSATDRDRVQIEIDRMNREGNTLVSQYKALNAAGSDPTRTAGERAEAAAAAKAKLEEIKAKQREVQAYLAAARAADPGFIMRKPDLGESVAGTITLSPSSPADAGAGYEYTNRDMESDRISLHLPKADLGTAFAAFEQVTGLRIVRDPSLASVRGSIDLEAEKVTKRQAFQKLSQALQQLNIVLEPGSEGTMVAKLSTR